MVCSGADGGKKDKKDNHGFDFAVRESIAAGICEGDVEIDCVGARFIKVLIEKKI